MTGCNPKNERIKRRYFDDLENAEGLAPVTIDHTARALAEYERFTNWQDFAQFSRKAAINYRKRLLEIGRRGARGGARSTVHSKLLRVEKFFRWLAGKPEFKSRIRYLDVECFSLSRKDQKIARHRSHEQKTPSEEQVLAAIQALPVDTDVQLRDRALMACLLLTACRTKALTTLQMKHIRRDGTGIDFDAREVETKGAKTFTTFFVPIGEGVREMLLDFATRLRVLGWADEDPLFPKTATLGAKAQDCINGMVKEPWRDTEAARRVCRRAFAAAGLDYYPPQAVRRTVIRVGQRRCRTAEEFKAWSQNVAHEDVLVTFRNYGPVPFARQAELIAGLTEDAPTFSAAEAERIARLVARELKETRKGNSDDEGSDS